jgi:hypothetical protein
VTRLLEEAFQKASKLSEAEQNALAASILADLDDERCWNEVFAASQDLLAELAAEAREESHAGRTVPLDPDRM